MMKVARILFLFSSLLFPLAACCQQVGEGFGPGCDDDVAKDSFTDCCPGRPCARTIQFHSKLVGAQLPYRVILPPWYNPAEGQKPQRYPVLYLLHGLGGHYTNWLEKTKLLNDSFHFNLIIVTPEGNDGWYTDSATVPRDKYESYILKELIPDVESRFRTIETRAGRSIAGLSMGGYGALKFGLKYPDKFIFVASISGALDAARRSDADPRNAWGFLRASIMQTFGAIDSPIRAGNDLHKLVRDFPAERLASLPFIYLDCGTEDGFFATNRDMANILLERKIPHEFRQLPGGHNWAYWGNQVREILKIAAQRMQPKQAAAFDVETSPYFLSLSIIGDINS
jgi:putative tributyrin esterase